MFDVKPNWRACRLDARPERRERSLKGHIDFYVTHTRHCLSTIKKHTQRTRDKARKADEEQRGRREKARENKNCFPFSGSGRRERLLVSGIGGGRRLAVYTQWFSLSLLSLHQPCRIELPVQARKERRGSRKSLRLHTQRERERRTQQKPSANRVCLNEAVRHQILMRQKGERCNREREREKRG